MKKIFPILIAIILWSCQNNTNTKESSDPDPITFSIQELWSTDTIFKTPESVYFDAKRDVLYVANMNRVDEGETGFISKLATDGSIIDLEWISGLKQPRGMGVYDDLLFAVDSDRLLIIDIEKGEIQQSIDVEGSAFLNDLAISEKGKVYFSDSQTGKVHTYENETLSTWLDSLPRPNGLYINEDNVILNCVNTQSVYAVDKGSKEMTLLADSIGAADGVEFSGYDNYYLITDWNGQIHMIGNNTVQKLLDTRELKKNTADLGYDISEKIMYIPTFYDNRVVAYKLKSE